MCKCNRTSAHHPAAMISTSMIMIIYASSLLAYITYLSKFIKPRNNIFSIFNGCTVYWCHKSTPRCLCC